MEDNAEKDSSWNEELALIDPDKLKKSNFIYFIYAKRKVVWRPKVFERLQEKLNQCFCSFSKKFSYS